jgi:hypothetical protein
MSRKRRGTGKRKLVKSQAGDFFARRTGSGRFKEMGDGRARPIPGSRSQEEGAHDRKTRSG